MAESWVSGEARPTTPKVGVKRIRDRSSPEDDVGSLGNERPGQVVWERWDCPGMGFKPSPYQAVQGILFCEEFILGYKDSQDNPFCWDALVLNLPGSEAYDSSMTCVYKWRSDIRRIAADTNIYVDDRRTTGPTRSETWRATRTAGARKTTSGSRTRQGRGTLQNLLPAHGLGW